MDSHTLWSTYHCPNYNRAAPYFGKTFGGSPWPCSDGSRVDATSALSGYSIVEADALDGDAKLAVPYPNLANDGSEEIYEGLLMFRESSDRYLTESPVAPSRRKPPGELKTLPSQSINGEVSSLRGDSSTSRSVQKDRSATGCRRSRSGRALTRPHCPIPSRPVAAESHAAP